MRNASLYGVVALALGGVLLFAATTAFAAPPVVPAPANFLPDTVNPVSGTCDAYNGAIAAGTQNSGGPLHHGACRYGDLSLLINGRPAASFWQSVQAGTAPAPFQPAATSSFFNTCVTARGLSLQLSANVQTALLNWTDAPVAPAKPICAAEWAQHNPATLVASSVLQATTTNFLHKAAEELNLAIAHSPPPKVCLPGLPNGALIHHAMLQIAGQYATLLANPITLINKRWNGVAATSTCPMHCSLCASGWVGKITETKTLNKGGVYYQETDTWLIGGQAPNQPANKIDIPAQWTAKGSGSYSYPTGGSVSWQTNGNVAGFCPPNNVSCIEALTQTTPAGVSVVDFHEINSPLVDNGAIQVTQTSSTGQSSTSSAAAGEDSINGLSPHIQIPVSQLPTPPPGHVSGTTCTGITLNPGGSTCSADWDWQLANQ